MESLWVGVWDCATGAAHAEKAVEFLRRMCAEVVAGRSMPAAKVVSVMVISIGGSLAEVRWHLRLLKRAMGKTEVGGREDGREELTTNGTKYTKEENAGQD